MVPDVTICSQKSAATERLHARKPRRLDAEIFPGVRRSDVGRLNAHDGSRSYQGWGTESFAVRLMMAVEERDIFVDFRPKIKTIEWFFGMVSR